MSHKMSPMRTRWVVAALLVACSAPRPRTGSGEPVLTIEGRIVGGAARLGAPDFASLPRRAFQARAPGASEATYDGVALHKFFGEELETERGADTAVFHGADGYEAPIAIAALRQHRPVLADRVDGAPIPAPRGPLVLAWPTSETPGLQRDPRARGWWVEGVTRIEVVSWIDSYGRALRVPAGAPDDARPGAQAFQTSCLACHRVRGRGGTRGPDLTERLAPTEARAGLAAALRAHRSTLVAELPATTVRQLSAFLGAVGVAGAAAPEDEPPPEPIPPAPPPRPPGLGPPPM